MRFSPTLTVIRSGETQTTAIAGGVDALAVRRKIVALQEAMESYGLPGVDEVTSIGRSLFVDYDPSHWTQASMKAALIALESTVARPEEAQPLQHFDWPLLCGEEGTNDLELAATAHGLTIGAFLTRLTRRTYIIQDFTMPGIAPQLFRRDFPHLQPGQQLHRNARRLSCGTLTLSSQGFTVATCETLSHDLVIGHVPPECVAPETAAFRVGDRVRFLNR
ncbi:carboxyltransferase domain-containing protein [Pseudarthrobacter sp. NPDC058329]|uniref:carboxyltransferase domain-containing protein n=1 Tax=Pseudarthrobacter sp. NPDC058329 TaxID=3346448 RepID=UPI0036DDD02D